MSARESDPRVPFSVPVATPEGAEAAVTKNISMGGMFLITKKRFSVGETVEMVLEIGGMRLDVRARVTHQQADGAGFSFVAPSPLLRNMLREQIDTLLSQGGALDEDTNPRLAARHAVSWSRGDGHREEARLRDLSLAGAHLDSTASVSIGETVYIYLPGFVATDRERASEVRGVEARVVHQSDHGFGVKFVGASAEFRMAIERLMMSLPASASHA